MPSRQVDALIVGAGIAGLLLARELRRRGATVLVVHDPHQPGASAAAVGLLNPVRGRRCTLAWRAQEVFAAAREVYAGVAVPAEGPVFRELPIVRAFDSAEERGALERRLAAIRAAGFAVETDVDVPTGFRGAAHGAAIVHGGGCVDARRVTRALREDLLAAGVLLERRAAPGDPAESIGKTAGIVAARTIRVAGASAIAEPSSGLCPVHGETLFIRAPALAAGCAFVCGHHLVPLGGGLWACGGTKLPGLAAGQPTPEGRAELEQFLHERVACAWEIVDHAAGVRATTLDTKPVVGPLRGARDEYVFNGFGSQGFALAPWAARVLADHLLDGAPLPREFDPERFTPRQERTARLRWHAVDVAHAIAAQHLVPGDLAIDLTAGNGGDTAWLAQAVGPEGAVLGVDIQPAAIEATRRRLAEAGCDAAVVVQCADHAGLAALVPGSWTRRVGAILANLGHLPGSSSPITTRAESTCAALSAGLPLLRPGGVLVVVIYTQHPGGSAELEAITRWAGHVPVPGYAVRWDRSPGAPAHAVVVLSVLRTDGVRDPS